MWSLNKIHFPVLESDHTCCCSLDLLGTSTITMGKYFQVNFYKLSVALQVFIVVGKLGVKTTTEWLWCHRIKSHSQLAVSILGTHIQGGSSLSQKKNKGIHRGKWAFLTNLAVMSHVSYIFWHPSVKMLWGIFIKEGDSPIPLPRIDTELSKVGYFIKGRNSNGFLDWKCL